MLVYAIVLILVMLATNNPQAKAVLHRISCKILPEGQSRGGWPEMSKKEETKLVPVPSPDNDPGAGH